MLFFADLSRAGSEFGVAHQKMQNRIQVGLQVLGLLTERLKHSASQPETFRASRNESRPKLGTAHSAV